MSNQLRTSEDVLLIDNFEGVNQLVHDLNLKSGIAPHLRGAFVDGKGNVERLPGKVANSSSSFGGPVFTLHQLEFSDHSSVFIHQSSSYKIETDVTELFSVWSVELTAPVDSFIF